MDFEKPIKPLILACYRFHFLKRHFPHNKRRYLNWYLAFGRLHLWVGSLYFKKWTNLQVIIACYKANPWKNSQAINLQILLYVYKNVEMSLFMIPPTPPLICAERVGKVTRRSEKWNTSRTARTGVWTFSRQKPWPLFRNSFPVTGITYGDGRGRIQYMTGKLLGIRLSVDVSANRL